jgi:hypothetical protein
MIILNGYLNKKKSKALVSKVTVSEKAQEASYLVTELVVQKGKSHTDGEKEIEDAPLSNSTINICTDVMSHDVEEVSHTKLKNKI